MCDDGLLLGGQIRACQARACSCMPGKGKQCVSISRYSCAVQSCYEGGMNCLIRRHRASRLTREAAQTLAKASGGKPAFEGPAWNGCTADMVRAARAHAHLVLQANFFDRVAGLQQEVGAP